MFNSTSPLIDTRRSFADARSSIRKPFTTNPEFTATQMFRSGSILLLKNITVIKRELVQQQGIIW